MTPVYVGASGREYYLGQKYVTSHTRKCGYAYGIVESGCGGPSIPTVGLRYYNKDGVKGGWDALATVDRQDPIEVSINPCSEISISNHTTMKDEYMTTKKLYEIKQDDKVLFGHKLTTNSSGLWVMEIKGSGDVICVDKANVEEVMPHTIRIQFDRNKQTYEYLAENGKYQVGEFYILDSFLGRAIVEIVAVDTKSARATAEFKPLAKLNVEKV